MNAVMVCTLTQKTRGSEFDCQFRLIFFIGYTRIRNELLLILRNVKLITSDWLSQSQHILLRKGLVLLQSMQPAC